MGPAGPLLAIFAIFGIFGIFAMWRSRARVPSLRFSSSVSVPAVLPVRLRACVVPLSMRPLTTFPRLPRLSRLDSVPVSPFRTASSRCRGSAFRFSLCSLPLSLQLLTSLRRLCRLPPRSVPTLARLPACRLSPRWPGFPPADCLRVGPASGLPTVSALARLPAADCPRVDPASGPLLCSGEKLSARGSVSFREIGILALIWGNSG